MAAIAQKRDRKASSAAGRTQSPPAEADPGRDDLDRSDRSRGDLDGGDRRHRALHAAATLVVGYLALSGVLIGAGLVVTHLLASSVGSWDEHVNAIFARHRTPTDNTISGDFTLAANTMGIIAVAAVAAVVLFVFRHARMVFRLAAALVLELATFLTTNYAVARPRPHVPHVGSTPSTFSWPSGHTAATLALYGSIALIVAATTRNRVATVAAWVFAAAMVVCVALSRVYRGEHHPTDTLAGIVIGAAVLWIASRALRAWQGETITIGRRATTASRRA